MTPVAELRDRLAGGLQVAIERARPDTRDDDEKALARGALWAALAPLDDVSRCRKLIPAAVAVQVEAAADVLRNDRQVLLAVLLSPSHLLDRVDALPDVCSSNHAWAMLCFVSEAAWRAVTAPSPGGSYAAGDTDLLLPVAARLRFLVLTEPLRRPASEEPARRSFDLPSNVFGDNTRHVFIGACREARWTWLRCLDEYQSHPLLAEADGRALEAEHDQVAFRCAYRGPRGRWMLGRPLSIPGNAPTDSRARLTATDTAVLAGVVERHLLPRFRLLRVSRLACAGPGLPTPWVGVGMALLAATVALILALRGWFTPAAGTGAAAFVLIGLGVIWYGRRWAAQWLLRLPAAGAVGLVLLVALAPTWWQHPTLRWPPVLVLVGASFGYLVVVARNHGVAPWAALGRSAGVTLAGLAHTFLVALIGLVLVAPSYAEEATTNDGDYTMLALWSDGALVGEAWSVLALATAWCLAAGVFSQILWEDRPVTAALAHLQWRRGRQ